MDDGVLINPFADVKMYPQDFSRQNSDQRKLSSVSDIRDSIKETHEEPSGFQTVPRFRPKTRPTPYFQDGTESVRSFVILKNNNSESSTLELTDEDDEEWSDEDSETEAKHRNKGFVNKVKNRVKSLVQHKN